MRAILSAGLLPAALPLVLGACAGRQALVVVLPNPDGSSGAVTLNGGRNSLSLDHPYAAAEVRGGKVSAITSDAEQVQNVFGNALAAQPIPPRHFHLYFLNHTDVMTPKAAQEYRSVFEDLKRRTVYEVEVVGHTDTMGEKAYNQQLSLRRATAIKDRLVRDGMDASSIAIAGRGKRDLLVQTADEVPEPLNRMVDITVR